MNAANAVNDGRSIVSVKKLDGRFLACRDFGYEYRVDIVVPRYVLAQWLHETFGPSMHPSYPRVLYKKSYWNKNPHYGFFPDQYCVFLSEQAMTMLTLKYA